MKLLTGWAHYQVLRICTARNQSRVIRRPLYSAFVTIETLNLFCFQAAPGQGANRQAAVAEHAAATHSRLERTTYKGSHGAARGEAQNSRVTRHTSHVTRHTSHITRHRLLATILCSLALVSLKCKSKPNGFKKRSRTFIRSIFILRLALVPCCATMFFNIISLYNQNASVTSRLQQPSPGHVTAD